MRPIELPRNGFLVLGRAGMDLYAHPPGTRCEDASTFFACLGGSAGNIAVGLSCLGCPVSLVSAVSDDAVGRFVLNELAKYGVETSEIHVLKGQNRTSLAVTETRIDDTQNVIYRNGAADLEITAEQISTIDYSAYGVLIVTGTALAAEPSRNATFYAMESARRAGLRVVMDVDYRPYSWESEGEASAVYRRAALACDILVGNDEEFALMAGKGKDGRLLAKEFAADSPRLVVYKMGERGSATYTDGLSLEHPVIPVTAIKPMGAGDAFMAGMLSSLASGQDLESAVGRGSAAAAMVVSKVGCSCAMPTSAELDAFVLAHA